MKEVEDIIYHFSAPIQIKMCDLDPFAHVNNGVQCNYFDYGRSQYFENVLGEKIDWSTMDLVLVHVSLDFYRPIKIHDEIICETAVYEFGNKSFKMIQRLRSISDNEVKTVCHSILSGFDREAEVSIPISEKYRKFIGRFEHLIF